MKKILAYIFVILALWGNHHLQAQKGNPFELKHRISTSVENNNKETMPDDKLVKTNNPFDIAENPIPKITISEPSSTRRDKTSATNATTKNDFLFWFFLIVLAFFTSNVTLSRKRIEQIYQAVFNDNFSRQLQRANQGSFSLGYLLLYILFFINAGLFVFLVTQHFKLNVPHSLSQLLYTCLGVAGVFIFKHALLYFVRSIFPISKEIKLYSFTIMSFSILLGIVLLPINIIAAFATESLAKMAIWAGLGAILATYLLRSFRGLSIGSKYWMLHTFHFLLYLCAVEILPVVVLVKVLMLGMS